KGETGRTYYTYDDGGEKLLTIAAYKKNKLERFTDYRCLPKEDTMKVQIMNVCTRTDKDPMGNILEIKEQKKGKKSFVMTYKYSPDHKKLLQVHTKGQKKKDERLVVYTHNEKNHITQI